MNKLNEFGGIADVYIINKVQKTIGNIEYQPGEPYTLLQNVTVQLEYKENISEANSKMNNLSHYNAFPSGITIADVPFTDKVCNLLMQRNNNKMQVYEKEIICCSENGIIYLSNIPVSNIYVKDSSFNNIEFTIDGEKITGNFIENEKYLVFYKKEIEINNFNLISNILPYFSLEIHFKGNTDKNFQLGYLFIDSSSLISSPTIVFNNENLVSTELKFNIIYNNGTINTWGI